MSTTISATDAVRSFSDLLNRIRYRGEEFIVERGGEPVCRISPAAPEKRLTLKELATRLRNLPDADTGFAAAVRKAAQRQGRIPRSPWGR